MLSIPRFYGCAMWVEFFFAYVGGRVVSKWPIVMLKQHGLRDLAQRQTKCHSYLRHGSNCLKDGWWQRNCDLKLISPPEFNIESKVLESRFYRFLESTWLLQSALLALMLYLIGGLGWLVWGVSVRVFVSVGGHWLVGFFAHNQGERTWRVEGAAVQGHNIPIAGFLSMGEAWHNNHHAFPGSAMLGLHKNEPDPGWWVLNALHNLGLVKNIVLPEDLPERSELVRECDELSRDRRLLEKCVIVNR